MNRNQRLAIVLFLTFARVPLVIAFLVAAVARATVARGSRVLFVSAFAFLAASAATDFLDGFFARRLKVTTTFGAHADPLTDKVFYLVTLPLLVFVAAMNAHIVHAVVLLALTVFMLVRDQWVSFLRAIGSIYGVSGGANWSGKLRTAVNFPLVCAVYFVEESGFFTGPGTMPYLYALEALGAAITLLSIYVYTRRYWPCILKSIASGQ